MTVYFTFLNIRSSLIKQIILFMTFWFHVSSDILVIYISSESFLSYLNIV